MPDTLRRVHLETVSSSHQATFGVLVENGIPFMVTVERPWMFNKPNESCLPAGAYIVERHISTKYGSDELAWIIKDVHGRSGMLVHVGNTIDDSKGCTHPGIYFAEVNGKPGVKDSRKALKQLAKRMNNEPFELIVHRPW
jgi:hypothetical protein